MSEANAAVTLEVFSDYVCPFCWLAKPGLDELRQGNPNVRIVWRAFELRPDPAPTLDPNGAYLDRVWRTSVYPMAERLNVPIHLPPVQPRSRSAHEAAKWAQTQSRFDDYNAALFRAFFERGEDIGEPTVLIRLAADLGLDADALKSALDGRTFEADVLADERDAAEMGLTGVPAFVADRRTALSGAQPTATLRAFVDRAREAQTKK